jgi:hypothetical protein
MEQPLPAKKMYWTIVIARDAMYIPRVDPIKTTLHTLDSDSSIFDRQYSAQVCARSTSKISPRRRKSMAPAKAMYFPQKMKNPSGMRNDSTIRTNQPIIFGPQNPFWMPARGSLDEFTPTKRTARRRWKKPKAKFIRCTATHP